ncbi:MULTISPECIES: hypothetical protein [unclassified Marinovum]
MAKRWHITRDAQGLTLSRHAVARFDVSAVTRFAPLRMVPLAHMIRQDMWRRLRGLRGFAPAVRIEQDDDGLRVTAGGAVAGRFPKDETEAQIKALLDDSRLRARWSHSALLTRRKVLL